MWRIALGLLLLCSCHCDMNLAFCTRPSRPSVRGPCSTSARASLMPAACLFVRLSRACRTCFRSPKDLHGNATYLNTNAPSESIGHDYGWGLLQDHHDGHDPDQLIALLGQWHAGPEDDRVGTLYLTTREVLAWRSILIHFEHLQDPSQDVGYKIIVSRRVLTQKS